MGSTYRTVVLAERPKDDIVPGQTFSIKTEQKPKESDLRDGEIIFESNYLSVDPAMRGWLNDTRSYLPPVKIGAVMRGNCIGTVIASKSQKFPVGSVALSGVGWTEYSKVKEQHLQKIDLPPNGRMTDALGVLGMTGLTAYFGLVEVGQVKAGDFVVVSAAAGATGSVVGQIAKLKGAKVLGIAGSDDKIKWLKDLGFDDALNYKDKDFAKKFRAATKDLIDVFFDNVGGEVLDLALSRAKEHSRFVMCGGISQYNVKKAEGPKNYLMIVSMRIRMQGFIVMDYEKEYPKALADLAQWLAEGKIKRTEYIVKGGIQNADRALKDLFTGQNTGKMLVEIKSPSSKMKSQL